MVDITNDDLDISHTCATNVEIGSEIWIKEMKNAWRWWDFYKAALSWCRLLQLLFCQDFSLFLYNWPSLLILATNFLPIVSPNGPPAEWVKNRLCWGENAVKGVNKRVSIYL
jgi:hypothetical protein